jgi:hypothetical protein
MPIALRDVAVPGFGVPLEAPRIPATTYKNRCRKAYARAESDWLVVYADREHLANIASLSGYDPRTDRSAPKVRSRRARNPDQGVDPAAVLDALVPSALWLASGRLLALV